MNPLGRDGCVIEVQWLLDGIEHLFKDRLAPAHRRPVGKLHRLTIIDQLGDHVAAKLDDSRRSRITAYFNHRRHRSPCPRGEAARIAFAHDPGLAQDLRDLIANAGEITTSSLQVGHGGREGIIAAVCLARLILKRVPNQDLKPIVSLLEQLQDALIDLNRGAVHPALKPADRDRGRPRDALCQEFRRRCVMATLLSLELNDPQAYASQLGLNLEDPDVYRMVHAVALAAAVTVGPFQAPPASRRDLKSDGGLIFTPQTIQRWVRAHRDVVRRVRQGDELREGRDPRSEPPEIDDQEQLELAQLAGTVALQREAYIKGLMLEGLHRSIDEIGADTKAVSAGRAAN